MKEYVAGFAFDYRIKVVLILKDHPTWQAGKLNGVGGHILSHELPEECMSREFHEEVGVKTIPADWIHFATLEGAHANDDGKSFRVYWFFTKLPWKKVLEVRSVTAEQIKWLPLTSHMESGIPIIPNVLWLLEMTNPQNKQDWPFHITERAELQQS